MQHLARKIFFGLLSIAILVGSARAQEGAKDRAVGLRVQLDVVQARQGELQQRLKKLDEDVKPENIEHSLTAVGSTHPEELREQRRRQIELERTSVLTELTQLSISRARLEQSIIDADSQAYRITAPVESIGTIKQETRVLIETEPSRSSTPNTQPARRIRKYRTRKHRTRKRIVVRIHVVFS